MSGALGRTHRTPEAPTNSTRSSQTRRCHWYACGDMAPARPHLMTAAEHDVLASLHAHYTRDLVLHGLELRSKTLCVRTRCHSQRRRGRRCCCCWWCGRCNRCSHVRRRRRMPRRRVPSRRARRACQRSWVVQERARATVPRVASGTRRRGCGSSGATRGTHRRDGTVGERARATVPCGSRSHAVPAPSACAPPAAGRPGWRVAACAFQVAERPVHGLPGDGGWVQRRLARVSAPAAQQRAQHGQR